MSPFYSPYLTQITIQNMLKGLLIKHAFQINNVTAREKIVVKVNRFLKTAWKISNLDTSIRLIYKLLVKLSYQWS